MHDDDEMDRLLREVLAADAPRLSAGFDTRVMRRVRPRRLTLAGRLVIAAYIVGAVATVVWVMRDQHMESFVAAVVVGVTVAAGASAYARRLTVGH